MSLLHYRTRPDRRAGIALIAVFAFGILGATLACALNGGCVPPTASSKVHYTKLPAPM